MKDLNETQSLAVEILRLAGLEVRLKENTFAVFQDGQPKWGFSTYSALDPARMMNEVLKDRYAQGVKAGREQMKKDIKKLLSIEG